MQRTTNRRIEIRAMRKRMRFYKNICVFLSAVCWFMAAAGADSYPAMTVLVVPAALFMYMAEGFRLRACGGRREERR